MKQEYIDTVRLLIDIAPVVFQSPRFAMKGGTALNLFVQDMPRLSVDIDVVFTDPSLPRDEALAAIEAELKAIAATLEARGLSITHPRKAGGDDVKLFVSDGKAEVKVEVNHVFRGSLLPVRPMPLTAAAQDMFTSDLAVPMLERAELYGSKLVAAMDRQHPRDIFDVLKMYEKFGLEAGVVDCFVAYLAGHGRPVHEVLFSNDAPFDGIYESHFRGMTMEEVALDTLLQTRARLKAELPEALTRNHKDFLLSLVKLEPAWDLLRFAALRDLPALKWKMLNLEKLKKKNPESFARQYTELAGRLGA
ncbi:MAG: nucleotidyl transferase AbiEii/AbiGii toxin family protein [Sphingomonas sp.]|uniref:Nucleotidyl transferase AbiEii/AbiGii toxin family protein n=1 Tax=Variovorax paradoxus TaxID=34073 RepID=A0A2W5QD49_VARPD|nr:nucleotidyl transferase AbiEii/AbiGii toxin family protein [Sphingomonas sp.]PZQ75292.1 MAG: nucleotidyl transferase AbiEii/AbiGii toxin family protein [Variovorax paradoxus]PZU73305.1 MAG: nucleotidyl transferase AbiEii/AbiGii toxin family protein [Sphingomonas sp.]